MEQAYTQMMAVFGFNRYIVECKLRMTMASIYGGMSFNRYIVECKSGT